MRAFNKDKLYEMAKEAIIKYKLILLYEVIAYLPCEKTTFYKYFPDNSDELNELRDLLEINKIHTKVEIRKKLLNSEKASELLALYRLCATPEERQILNQHYVEIEAVKQKQGILPLDLTIKKPKQNELKANND